MASRLGAFFKHKRIENNLTLGQIARLVGYTSVAGGCNKITRFERTGQVHDDLLAKLANVLDIDSTTISTLIDADRQESLRNWWKWINEPIEPHVIVRLMAAVYLYHPLPDDLQGVRDAEEYASHLSRLKRKRCCLVVSRRYSVWFDEEGKVECRTEAIPGEPNAPYMRLGRGRRPFLLRTVSGADIIKAMQWPSSTG